MLKSEFVSHELLTLVEQHTSKPRVEFQYEFCLRIISSGLPYTQSQTPLSIQPQVNLIKDENILKETDRIIHFLLKLSNMKTKNRFTEIQKPLEAVTTSLGRSIKSNQQELAAAIIGGSNKEASDYFESYYLNIQQITEHSLVRDLIYILQGIPSKFILLKNTQITTYKHLPRPTLALIEKITRLGQVYCDIKMKMNMKEGLFKQSLKEFISKELHKYYHQLSLLEQSMDKEDGSKNYTARTMTLKKLYVWHLQPLQKLTTILSILNQTEDIKGGEMLSVISKYKTHGNKAVSSFVDEMIKEITIPFNEMVKKWVYQGELEDPFGEFFIEKLVGNDSNPWKSKFKYSIAKVPSFVNDSQIIFKVGKTVNYIKNNMSDTLVLDSRISLAEIDQKTSKYLLEQFNDKYKLKNHLKSLKNYLFLAQGDFVQQLMDSLSLILNKKSNFYKHDLISILSFAINASNAQFDTEIESLDCRVLEMNSNECGWDVFVLDYSVKKPLDVVLGKPQLFLYHKAFTFLWKLKRVEFQVIKSWKSVIKSGSCKAFVDGESAVKSRNQASLFVDGESDVKSKNDAVPLLDKRRNHAQNGASVVKSRNHKAQLFVNEIMGFINELQRFFYMDVIEFHWTEFLKSEICDLDGLIEAHDKYLGGISKDIFNKVFEFGKVFGNILGVCEVVECLAEDDDGQVLEILLQLRQEFEVLVKELLEGLSKHQDSKLQFLAARLDFNNYYSSE